MAETTFLIKWNTRSSLHSFDDTKSMHNRPQLNHLFVAASLSWLQPVVTAAALGSVHVREENRMSFVSTWPEALTAAVGTLQGIGAAMSAQNLQITVDVLNRVPR